MLNYDKEVYDISGINLPDNFMLNGVIHRFGSKQKNWAIGHEFKCKGRVEKLVSIGDWSSGRKFTYCSYSGFSTSNYKKLPTKVKNEVEHLRNIVSEEKQKSFRGFEKKWKVKYSELQTARQNDYLSKKRIMPWSAKQLSSNLIVGIYNNSKQLTGVQKITSSGGKFFEKGSDISGNYNTLREDRNSEYIFVAEGFATSASIAESVPFGSVVCAFSASNIPKVTKSLKEINKNCKIIICADADSNGVGEKYAKKATKLNSNTIYILPKGGNSSDSDFNDLARNLGEREVAHIIQKSIDSFYKFDFQGDIKNGFTKIIEDKEYKDYERLFQYFNYLYKYFILTDGSRVYIFDKTHFRQIQDIEIKSFAEQHFCISDKTCTSYDVGEFCKKVLRNNLKCNIDLSFQNGGRYINFLNGVLDLEVMELLNHSSEYMFTHVIPHEFDKKALSPNWDKALSNVFSDDLKLQKCIEEYFGFIISNMSYEYLVEILVLDGSGANGKSTIIDAIRYILGDQNVSAVPLYQLSSNRFVTSHLSKSLLNISEEEPKNVFEDPNSIKRLTGGSLLYAEQKCKDGYSFLNRSKIITSFNEPPVFKERTEGFKRRLLIIPFNINFNERKDLVIDNIRSKLQSESPGIIIKAVEGLIRLRKNKAFSKSERTVQRYHQIEELSSPVQMWWNNCVIKSDVSSKVKSSDLYDSFLNTTRSQISQIVFAREVKLIIKRLNSPNIQYKQLRFKGGSNVKGITGITITDV